MTWLPVGLSLMAALNSGIDYVMQPAAVIKFGLILLVGNLSWLLLYPYVFFITLPMFRRLNVTAADGSRSYSLSVTTSGTRRRNRTAWMSRSSSRGRSLDQSSQV